MIVRDITHDHGHEPGPDSFRVVPTDRIPNFAKVPTLRSIGSGLATFGDVWGGRPPEEDDVITIENGDTVVVHGDMHAKVISVRDGGTLRFSRVASSRLTVCTLLVEDHGTLDMGTEDDPIPDDIHHEIIFADKPFDLVFDPYQYGNGLIVMGRWQAHGAAKTSGPVPLAREARKGQSSIRLASPVEGWKVGDVIIFPDTRQLSPEERETGFGAQTEERRVRYVSADRLIVGLDAPLEFDHLGARDYWGRLVLLPHVGNITRNIVLRSENPDGVRGHTMYHGYADIDVRYVAFEDLGRTTTDLIDLTRLEAGGLHIGTNQIARYAAHFHFVIGPQEGRDGSWNFRQGRMEGCCFTRARKFGLSVHGTSFVDIIGNIAYRCRGGGIITESGWEKYNLIKGNFACHIDGTGEEPHSRRPLKGRWTDVSHEGSGFWNFAALNFFEDNVAATCRHHGWSQFPSAEPVSLESFARWPYFPGSSPFADGQYTQDGHTMTRLIAPPVARGNTAYGCMIGAAVWGGVTEKDWRQEWHDTTVWHCWKTGIQNRLSIKPVWRKGVIIGDRTRLKDGKGTIGYDDIYADLVGFNIQNYNVGILTESPRSLSGIALQIQDGFLANDLDFYMRADTHYSDRPTSVILRNISYPEGSLPSLHLNYWFRSDSKPLLPINLYLLDHNGKEGNNYRLYFRCQHPDWEAPGTWFTDPMGPNPYAGGPGHYGGMYLNIDRVRGLDTHPKDRILNSKACDRFGRAVAGSVSPTTDTLPGVRGEVTGDLNPKYPGALPDTVFGHYGRYEGLYAAPLAETLEDVYSISGTKLIHHPQLPVPELPPIDENPQGEHKRIQEQYMLLSTGLKESLDKMKVAADNLVEVGSEFADFCEVHLDDVEVDEEEAKRNKEIVDGLTTAFTGLAERFQSIMEAEKSHSHDNTKETKK